MILLSSVSLLGLPDCSCQNVRDFWLHVNVFIIGSRDVKSTKFMSVTLLQICDVHRLLLLHYMFCYSNL